MRPTAMPRNAHAMVAGRLGAALAATLLTSCGSDGTSMPTRDASPDATTPDASSRDAGGPDAASPDPDAGRADADTPNAPTFWDEWGLPSHFPEPKVPDDNPMSVAKVELGRHLFYDNRLSGNQTQSCASCHQQELAFTDGLARAVGSTGETHPRSSMSLTNIGYASSLTWANNVLSELKRQALVPMFGEDPVELGMAGMEEELVRRLSEVPEYQTMFAKAYPDDEDPITLDHVTAAIATFQRVLISGSSPYDRYLQGDTDALTAQQERGRKLFFSETTECFHCHGGFNLSDSATHEGKVFDETAFHNTALYNLDGQGKYPEESQGIIEQTGRPSDMGRFKAPTLRNIELTAPYMHDGSIATLEGVIDHYAAGGRTIEEGPYAGDGSRSPLKSEFLTGFDITEEDKQALIAFLKSLTDERFLEDPRFSNPWKNQDAP